MLKGIFITVVVLSSLAGFAQQNTGSDVKTIINYEVVSPSTDSILGIQIDSVSLLMQVTYQLDSVNQVAFQFDAMPWLVQSASTTATNAVLHPTFFEARSAIMEFQEGDSVLFRYTYQNDSLTFDTTTYTLIF